MLSYGITRPQWLKANTLDVILFLKIHYKYLQVLQLGQNIRYFQLNLKWKQTVFANVDPGLIPTVVKSSSDGDRLNNLNWTWKTAADRFWTAINLKIKLCWCHPTTPTMTYSVGGEIWKEVNSQLLSSPVGGEIWKEVNSQLLSSPVEGEIWK